MRSSIKLRLTVVHAINSKFNGERVKIENCQLPFIRVDLDLGEC